MGVGSAGMMIDTAVVVGNGALFHSLAALRAAHSNLLRREHEATDTSEFLAQVAEFIQRGQATGALLNEDAERRAAQSLLDYWATTLYRTKQAVPDSTLAAFDIHRFPKLDDALCPYRGLDAFREVDHAIFFGRERL